jgi:hypothetical protein
MGWLGPARPLACSEMDDGTIRCSECDRSVDEFTAIAERSGYWSDGCGELLPFCPQCAEREFTPDASASAAVVPRDRPRPHA